MPPLNFREKVQTAKHSLDQNWRQTYLISSSDLERNQLSLQATFVKCTIKKNLYQCNSRNTLRSHERQQWQLGPPRVFRSHLRYRPLEPSERRSMKGIFRVPRGGGGVGGWESPPGALNVFPWSPEPHRFVSWSPNIILLQRLEPSKRLLRSQKPQILKFRHSCTQIAS